jgi:hypothetical protein
MAQRLRNVLARDCSVATLRELVLEKLTDGRLPCRVPYRTWAGPAQGGNSCGLCDTTITQDQTEFDVDCGQDIGTVLHSECFSVWESECRRLIETGGGALRGTF